MTILRIVVLLIPLLLAFALVSLPADIIPPTMRQAPVLIATLCATLLLSGGTALLTVFVFGLALDMLLYLPLGLYALTLTSLAAAVGFMQPVLSRQPIWQHLIFVALALCLHEIIWVELLAWLGTAPPGPHWWSVLISLMLWLPLVSGRQQGDRLE